MSERMRVLEGGPMHGGARSWREHLGLEIYVFCPAGGNGDRARYDKDGVYQHSVHFIPAPLEPCGKCSLCPGHRVGLSETLVFQHGEHPEVEQ